MLTESLDKPSEYRTGRRAVLMTSIPGRKTLAPVALVYFLTGKKGAGCGNSLGGDADLLCRSAAFRLSKGRFRPPREREELRD